MPALFAYLISISVFLGAGYGGLHWLAEPTVRVSESRTQKAPVKPASKVALAAPPSIEAESADQETDGVAAADLAPQLEDPAPTIETATIESTAAVKKPATVQNTAASEQKIPQPGRPKIASKSNTASEHISTPSPRKPQQVRQADRRRKPIVMVLRTIEYPDGRRESRLLSVGQAKLAYQSEDR